MQNSFCIHSYIYINRKKSLQETQMISQAKLDGISHDMAYIHLVYIFISISEGNNDPNYDPLDICFGGRRKFVGGSYVDFGKFQLKYSWRKGEQRRAVRTFITRKTNQRGIAKQIKEMALCVNIYTFI